MEFPEKTTIQSCTVPIVPRYNETDQGGIIHHSIYPIWFELGRTKLLRENGLAYSDLEEHGTFFVMAELNIKYKRPAKYDQRLDLETTCSLVTAGRVEHTYKLTDARDGQLIAEGLSVLVCVGKDGAIKRMPKFMYPTRPQRRRRGHQKKAP